MKAAAKTQKPKRQEEHANFISSRLIVMRLSLHWRWLFCSDA